MIIEGLIVIGAALYCARQSRACWPASLALYLATGLVASVAYISHHNIQRPAERVALGILVTLFWPLLRGKE
jgi:hypothetical protein